MISASAQKSSPATGIAIIGMAGRFPGARDVATFWQNLVTGRSTIRTFSRAEMLAAGIRLSPTEQLSEQFAGALIDDVDRFDADFFGFTAEEAVQTDPQQRIFLECAWEALELAGYDSLSYRGTIGVFAGMGAPLYSYYHQPHSFDEVQHADVDILTSDVAYRLNLHGPSVTVQAFCSTSLAAVHLACRTLAAYDCDIALAGGVQLAVPQPVKVEQQRVVGGGGGVVVLKRVNEAIADGDMIYAVIRGSAMNNNGNVGMWAEQIEPNVYGQIAAIDKAHISADTGPGSFGLIELHRAAHAADQLNQITALVQAFQRGTQQHQFCALGTTEPNIGHLDRASGIASLIKASLALLHGQLPPALDTTLTSSSINLHESPFYLNTQLASWPTTAEPRRAGVTSSGHGTNVHLVLEEPPTTPFSETARPFQLLLLSARTPLALAQMANNLAAYCRNQPEVPLADIAYTLHVGRRHFGHQHTVVCRDRLHAIMELESATMLNSRLRPSPTEHNLIWHFPLASLESFTLARELYANEPLFRVTADRCYKALGQELLQTSKQQTLGKPRLAEATSFSLLELFELLTPTLPINNRIAIALLRPLTFCVQYALAQLLLQWGIRPHALSGWGVGEYVAACVAGVLSLTDALSLLTAQAEDSYQAPEETALLVPLAEQEVHAQLAGTMRLVYAGEAASVVVGEVALVHALTQAYAKEGVHCSRLGGQIAGLFGTPLASANSFHERLTKVHPLVPTMRLLSSSTGRLVSATRIAKRAYWRTQLATIVRPIPVPALVSKTVLLEMVARNRLSQFVQVHGGAEMNATNVITIDIQRYGSYQAGLLEALSQLYALGFPVHWERLYEGQHRRRVPLPTYPFERQSYWPNQAHGTPVE